MFPVYEPQEEIKATTGKKTFLFDFSIGEFMTVDGRVKTGEGIDALKLRIEKVLKTEKFRFKVYESEGDEYGVTLLEYLNSGLPRQFIESEIERETTEALLKDEDVSSVSAFIFTKDKRILTASFSVNTIYGEVIEFGI